MKDLDRIDFLLGKIADSGIESLSYGERFELDFYDKDKPVFTIEINGSRLSFEFDDFEYFNDEHRIWGKLIGLDKEFYGYVYDICDETFQGHMFYDAYVLKKNCDNNNLNVQYEYDITNYLDISSYFSISRNEYNGSALYEVLSVWLDSVHAYYFNYVHGIIKKQSHFQD